MYILQKLTSGYPGGSALGDVSSIYLTIASIFEGAPGKVWIRDLRTVTSPKPVSKG